MFYKDRGVLRTVSNVCDEAFWGTSNWLLAFKNFAILSHYPRKIKYRQNIPKNISFFVIEGRTSLGPLNKTLLRTEITKISKLL